MTLTAEPEPATPGYRRTTVVGVLVLLVLAAMLWAQPPWNARLQTAWIDAYQVVAPRRIESTPATVVEIDEKSLAALGQWPWPRTVLADLIRAIAQHRPAAIGIDILMPEADRLSPERVIERARQQDPILASRLAALRSNDSELARAIAEAPVVLALAGTVDATGAVLRVPPFTVANVAGQSRSATSTELELTHFSGVLTSIDELDRAAVGHGLISVGPGSDVIRRVPLVSSVNGTLAPALSIEMLRVALQAPALRVMVDGPVVDGIAIKDFAARTEHDGAVRIYYSHRDARRYLSAVDVLTGKVDPLRIEQKLVLIGTTGLGLVDYQNTPVGERMPGSEIQAQLLENLYDQTLLRRPPWSQALEIIAFTVLGLLLIWAVPRWRPRDAALLAIGCVLLVAASAYAAFRWQRMLFDAATPGLSLMILFIVLLVLTLTESTRQRRVLERIVASQRERAAHAAGELAAAQRVQTGMLPRSDLLRGDHRVDLAALMVPARDVGGDLYDYFRLDARRLFFLIGDVAGKGLSASMFMAVSKALYKSTALNVPGATIGDLMSAANVEVSRDNSEMFFVTAFAGVLDLDSGELSYCNAGHENPCLVVPNRIELVRLDDAGGPPLCTVEGFPYRDAHYRMQPGALLCLVTDGVTEAQNPAHALYGGRRLEAVLARSRNGATKAHAVVEAIRADVEIFAEGAEPSDDLTIFVLRWLGPGTSEH